MINDAVIKFLGRRRVAAVREVVWPLAASGATPTAYRVVIVGGGVAALETALALRALGGDRVSIQIVAADPQFRYGALEVREPFAGTRAPRYDLADLAASIGAELVVAELARVAPLERLIFTGDGDAIGYDAVVLCLGARPVRRYEHGRMVEPGKLDEVLHGFVQDVEGGYVHSAAFIVPDRMAWPLPIYELALMTAERAADMQADVDLTLITSEAQPLGLFGAEAAAAVTARLAAAGITLLTSAHTEVPGNKRIDVTIDGRRRQLTPDSIIALPELRGPAPDGVPCDARGFITVDEFGMVRGQDRVFAAGDATDHVVKQGGLAAQQAEVVARGVARLAGAPVARTAYSPDPSGVLLTGGLPIALGAAPAADEPSSASGGTTPAKIAAPRLAAYLALHAPVPAGARA